MYWSVLHCQMSPLLDHYSISARKFFFPCTNTNLSNTSTALVPLQVEDEARGFAIEHSQDQLVKGPERKEKKGKKIVDGLSFFFRSLFVATESPLPSLRVYIPRPWRTACLPVVARRYCCSCSCTPASVSACRQLQKKRKEKKRKLTHPRERKFRADAFQDLWHLVIASPTGRQQQHSWRQ